VLEFHSHLTWSKGLEPGDEITVIAKPPELLPVMDAKDVRVMVNLTGGYGAGLRQAIATHVTPHPERFVVFTEPWWSRVNEPGYAEFQAGEVIRAYQLGARGLKILKTLGLGARDHGNAGPFIKVDDARFDPMWEAAGAMNMPVMIHVSDPRAFLELFDRFNERWEELHNWPEWSFHGPQFPSNLEPSRNWAGNRAPPDGSSSATRTESSSAPTPSRATAVSRSRCSATRCMRFTIDSSKPRTSTSTTRRRTCRRRGGGGSTGSGYPIRCYGKCIGTTARDCSGLIQRGSRDAQQ
jgi:hypothetical protein